MTPTEPTEYDELDRMVLGEFAAGGYAAPVPREVAPPGDPALAGEPAADRGAAISASAAAARGRSLQRAGEEVAQVEDATPATPRPSAGRRWTLPLPSRRIVVVTLAGSALAVCVGGAGFFLGRGTGARSSSEFEQAVASPVQAAASASFGEAVQVGAAPAASAADLGQAPAPAAVLAAASAALPPVSSLPPAVDERKAGVTKPPSSTGPASAPQAQAIKESLIALGDEDKVAPAPTAGSAPPATAPRAAASAPRPAQPAASSADIKASKQPAVADSTVKRMKYGAMGITALTSTAVVVVGPQGQRAIQVGQALPDGTVLQAIEAKAHRFTTNQGTVQLD